MRYFGDLVTSFVEFLIAVIFFAGAIDTHSWHGWFLTALAGWIAWMGINTLRKRDVKVRDDLFMRELIRSGGFKIDPKSVDLDYDQLVTYLAANSKDSKPVEKRGLE